MDDKSVLIVVIGIVILVALAMYLGRGLRIKKDGSGFSIEAEEANRNQRLSVAKNADIDARKVGDVTGIKSDATNVSIDSNVDVLEGAKVKVDEIGNISGVEIKSKTGKE